MNKTEIKPQNTVHISYLNAKKNPQTIRSAQRLLSTIRQISIPYHVMHSTATVNLTVLTSSHSLTRYVLMD